MTDNIVPRRGDLALRGYDELPKHITREQYRAILNIAYKRMRDEDEYRARMGMRDAVMFRLLWETGGRVSDVCDMRYSDIDVAGMLIKLRVRKTGKTTGIPIMDSTLLVFLEAYGKKWGKIGENGEIIDDNILDIKRTTAFNTCREYGQLIGLHLHPHMFRHGVAVDMRMEAVDLQTIADRLGHSDISTTARYYAIMTPEMQKRNLEARGWTTKV